MQFIYPPGPNSGISGVTSLNTQTGALTLAAGTNITITPSGGNTLTIDASSGGATSTSDSHITTIVTDRQLKFAFNKVGTSVTMNVSTIYNPNDDSYLNTATLTAGNELNYIAGGEIIVPAGFRPQATGPGNAGVLFPFHYLGDGAGAMGLLIVNPDGKMQILADFDFNDFGAGTVLELEGHQAYSWTTDSFPPDP